MEKILLFVIAASTFVVGGNKDNNDEKIYNSNEVTVFDGKAWSSVIVKNDVPQQLSFIVNDAVLNTAPAPAEGPTGRWKS